MRAFEFPDRDPIAVSQPADFGGPITALWVGVQRKRGHRGFAKFGDGEI